MKIIMFDRTAADELTEPPSVKIAPDSAIVPSGFPMFLADYSAQWEGELFLAFRISRLGKGISTKFAPRYYDAVTLALRGVAVGLEQELQRDGRDMGLTGALDSSIATGQWQPLSADGKYSMEFNGVVSELAPSDVAVDEAIHILSRYMTLKTGDIVMPCRIAVRIPLERQTVVKASLNSTGMLTQKIK